MVSWWWGIPSKEKIKRQGTDMIETAWERVAHSVEQIKFLLLGAIIIM